MWVCVWLKDERTEGWTEMQLMAQSLTDISEAGNMDEVQ